MECPVCGNKKVSPFATHCLECGADVLAFPLLDDLEEQCVVTLKEKLSLEGELTALTQLRKSDKKNYQRKIGRMYWFLLLFPLMFFWCAKKPVTDKMAISDLKAENEALRNDITTLENRIESLSKIPTTEEEPKKIVHIVKEGETLYLLAVRYLGSGAVKDWETFLDLNPHIENPNFLPVGDTIVIKHN